MPATIILVDDHPVFRQGLRNLIGKEKGLIVVGEANDGQMAIDLVRQKCPDLAVMDINMPHLNGIEATRQIISECSTTRVLALSVHSGKQFVRDMIEAGASGYILKESIPEEMIEGIRSVLAGNIYLSKSISSKLVSDYKALLSESRPEPDERSTQILYTKLHRPPIANHVIPRTRLIEVLANGAESPLTLIVAPAGYGKSILASQWLDVAALTGAWVSLDNGDNDLRVFLSYIIEAIQSVVPQQELKTRSFLAAHKLPSVKLISQHLLNDLEQIPDSFILVLDDYHHIHTDSIHDFFSELLVHPSPHMHLVLITRRDPPLPLTSLRARGMLNLISTKDLRFTVQETKSFLERFLRIAIADNTAQVLEEKMEGWVTGLHLAALSIRNEADQERLIVGLLETNQYVREYLIQEVFSIIPPKFRRYFLQTAILNRFCAPICEALSLDDSEGQQMEADASARDFIDWLIKTQMFVIPLDNSNRWFRYHHLFRDLLLDLLKQRYSAEEIAALQLRASEWFAKNGPIEEALQHAISTNDIRYAVKLVERQRHNLMNREEWSRLELMLKMLPPEALKKNPLLLASRAFIFEHRGQVAESFADRDRAESLLSALQPESPEQKEVKGMIAVLHGEERILLGEGDRALECAERALRLLPAEALHIRSYAIAEKVLSYQIAGDIGTGLKIINEILNARALLPGITQARMMLWFCIAYWMEGDLNGLKQPALQCLKLGEQHALPESICLGRYFLGVLHYVRNELSEAERYLAAVVDDPFTARPQYLVQSAFALACIYTPHGRDDEASNVIESVISHVMETNDTLALSVARAFQVELALRQRKIPEAHRLNEHAAYDPYPPVWFFYVPQLTPVKLLLAQNTSDSLEKAFTLLDQIDGFVRKTNRKTIRIDVLALQALILDAQGKEPAAMERLTESLVLARPGGFIRNFVDMGPPMVDLLKRMHRQNVAVDYIENLLAAFNDDEQVVAPNDHPVASPYQPLTDPMTNRELDVLELLAERLQNKEIADKLYVSPETVKGHLKNIYQKLGVSNRRQAVEKAKRLNVI